MHHCHTYAHVEDKSVDRLALTLHFHTPVLVFLWRGASSIALAHFRLVKNFLDTSLKPASVCVFMSACVRVGAQIFSLNLLPLAGKKINVRVSFRSPFPCVSFLFDVGSAFDNKRCHLQANENIQGQNWTSDRCRPRQSRSCTLSCPSTRWRRAD